MEENYIPIGKMAEMNHVTIATLRHYDAIGLLKPKYVNEETGYRYYDIAQNARLDLIAYMRELGMSLAEIQAVFAKEDISLIEDILGQKKGQMEEQMKELHLRKKALDRTIHAIERYRSAPVTGIPALEFIEKRWILAIPCSENFYLNDSISGYERVLGELRQVLMKKRIPNIHSYNNGTSIAKEDYEKGDLIAKDVFVFLDEELGEQVQPVSSGMYACIYADSYTDEIPFARKLLAFCQKQDYRIAGDYICEIITEFNVFDSEERSMFMRLQVPVTFS